VRLLLDTHVLLWWLKDDPNLKQETKQVISSRENLVFVSSVSPWEISIKKALGKLTAPDNLLEVVAENSFESLVITLEHGLQVGKLPNHHNDPFDRMLIAQALFADLTIVTRDAKFNPYGVQILAA